MLKHLALSGMAIAVLTGCVTASPVLEPQGVDAKAKQFHASGNVGTIYVYAEDQANNFMAPLGLVPMIVNGKQIGAVDTSTYLAVTVPPGQYVVSGLSSDTYPVKVEVSGGDIHFVQFTYTSDHFMTDQVSEEQGRAAVLVRLMARAFPVVPGDQPVRVEIAK